MAATIQIHEMSALAAGTDKTLGTVRFKDADNATVDSSNPLVKPAADTIWSYSKKLRAYMEDPPNTSISNLRWYSDGANGFGAGIGVTVKNLGVTWGANYKTAMTGGADLFGYTQSSPAPLDGDATDAGPFAASPADIYIGDLIELQMSVAAAASSGTLTSETLTFAYDEI
jgi:hypothetical protein